MRNGSANKQHGVLRLGGLAARLLFSGAALIGVVILGRVFG